MYSSSLRLPERANQRWSTPCSRKTGNSIYRFRIPHARRARGEFRESAEVHGHYYASSRLWIEGQLRRGQDIVLEIDWQGAWNVRQEFPDAVGVFILPPSLEALKERLYKRGQDTPG